MKLLFDENISYRIVKMLQAEYHDASHVKFHNLLKADDKLVWEFARNEKFIIVTNDADFNDFSLVWGFPPKVIWLRTGNKSTKYIAQFLLEEKQQISEFVNDAESGILIFE